MQRFSFIMVLLFSIIVGMSSCKKEDSIPDQNKIYAIYSMDYNHSLNKTTAIVSFYHELPSSSNQQKLELTYPSQVSYNGDNLVFESVKRYYIKEFVGLVESSFDYTNYYGDQFINNVIMVDSISLNVSDSADTQNDYYFQVFGEALQANEVIDVQVESLTSGFSLGSSFENISGLNVQINSAQLAALGTGTTVVKVSRRSNISEGVDAPQVGGLIEARYTVQDTVYIY